MNKAPRILLNLISAACIATCITQGILLGVLWNKGYLRQERLYDTLAAARGIDDKVFEIKDREAEIAIRTEQPSYNQRIESRWSRDLDHDIREAALDNALLEMWTTGSDLAARFDRFEAAKRSFHEYAQSLQKDFQDEALREFQVTVENMKPAQAKDQILQMLENGELEQVVMLIQGMPTDKRKKIVGEFKDEFEKERLYEVLKELYRGEPFVSQFQDRMDDLDRM